MGLPELPVEEEVYADPSVIPPLPSEDSDNESDSNTVDGYQLLATGDDNSIALNNDLMNDSDDNVSANEDEQVQCGAVHDPNLPHIDNADVAVERQVWNEPRPEELQIELDSTKTSQILNAMANITLPNITVPEWAKDVPEERWKEELLERIRLRTDTLKKTPNKSDDNSANQMQ